MSSTEVLYMRKKYQEMSLDGVKQFHLVAVDSPSKRTCLVIIKVVQ